MHLTHENIVSLLESLKIDKLHVVCYFRCDITKKTIVSRVPFEPYEGKIEFTWHDILFHPIKSYNRYYHTPITIYDGDCEKTIVLKAFEKVSKHFVYNMEKKRYICVLQENY